MSVGRTAQQGIGNLGGSWNALMIILSPSDKGANKEGHCAGQHTHQQVGTDGECEIQGQPWLQ